MQEAPRRRAFLTGITGQDGSYLAESLIERGYEVWGLIRRSSSFNTSRIEHLYQDPHERDVRLRLVYGDLSDGSSLARTLAKIRPDEVYNLGAQSHVAVSFETPEYTADVTGLGAVRLLEAIRETEVPTRYYQASSSELFGGVQEHAQSEATPFHPRSPYAAAKAYAYYVTQNYREAYGMFAVNGILFNHESPRRGETFVTRKITRAVGRIAEGLQDCLYLGNLDAKRDWGYAPDYVRAMWMMLQSDKPSDYVIATGETHTVREFCERSFARAGLAIEWHGEGVDEHARSSDGRKVIAIDPRYFRPSEVDFLLGDPGKARAELAWAPEVGFGQLVDIMTDADLKLAQQERLVQAAQSAS